VREDRAKAHHVLRIEKGKPEDQAATAHTEQTQDAPRNMNDACVEARVDDDLVNRWSTQPSSERTDLGKQRGRVMFSERRPFGCPHADPREERSHAGKRHHDQDRHRIAGGRSNALAVPPQVDRQQTNEREHHRESAQQVGVPEEDKPHDPQTVQARRTRRFRRRALHELAVLVVAPHLGLVSAPPRRVDGRGSLGRWVGAAVDAEQNGNARHATQQSMSSDSRDCGVRHVLGRLSARHPQKLPLAHLPTSRATHILPYSR
jgi:hypothetical protein